MATATATAASTAPTAPFASFRGHRGAVHALLSDDDKHAHVLVSGSADGTCRLWDVRTARATKCINVRKALGWDAQHDDPDDAAANALAFGGGPQRSQHLYVAAGSKVLTFDVRQEALILDTAAREHFQDASDEINHLAVHPSKPAKYLAAPDDSGDIRIYDLDAHRLHKTLRGQHTNICMSAPFRPNAAWDLVSGGMDGLLLFWDFSRGRMKFCIDLNAGVTSIARGEQAVVPTQGTGAREEGAAAETTTSQMFNPPLVHSVAFAASGKSLAAGLGDATIAVVDFQSQQIVRRLNNHNAAVSQVHVPAFKRDEWLLSCANDAKVTIWDYAGALGVDGSNEERAHVVKDFAVRDKPNAIATSLHQNLVHVADMSNLIAAYPLL